MSEIVFILGAIFESNFENSHELYTRASFRVPYKTDGQLDLSFIIVIFRSGKIVLEK